MSYYRFPAYVRVADKRRKAERKLKQLMKKNPRIKPVVIEGRALATTWWGKSWNRNLERYADYENRIGRGRSYVRHSAVLDLQVAPGKVNALVQGSASKPYEVQVKIKKISPGNWKNIKKACEGKFDSLKKLLSGKFPKAFERLFTEKGKGLFPTPKEIEFSCSCPDWATMCKHVAATLYGIGARLDEYPGLFFKLRQVRVENLVSQAVTETSRDLLEKATIKTARVLEDTDLSDVFGIDLDMSDAPPVSTQASQKAATGKRKRPETAAGKKKTAKAAFLKKAPLRKSRFRPKGKTDSVNKTAAGIDTVEKIINRSKGGITTRELVTKTGLDVTKVRYFIARLKHQNKITTLSRGIYTSVNPPRRRAGLSDTAWVADIVRRSRKGVTVSDIVEKTNFQAVKVRNAIFRLKTQGKIKAVSRGLFKKA